MSSQHLDASFSEPNARSQLRIRLDPLLGLRLRLRLRFRSFFKGASLPNCAKFVERDFLIAVVQQLDILSITVQTYVLGLMLVGLRTSGVSRDDLNRGMTVLAFYLTSFISKHVAKLNR